MFGIELTPLMLSLLIVLAVGQTMMFRVSPGPTT